MSSPQSQLKCEMCGARVATLRRGRCWVCYIRWAETRPVGKGAACAVCHDRRLENLRMVEFRTSWIPMCHNCGTKAYRLTPLPQSLEGLTQRLGRDRRWSARRRGSKDDSRIRPRDRRDADRRAVMPVPEEIWEDAEELIIEASELPRNDDHVHELTCIVKPPQETTNKVSRQAVTAE